MYQWLEMGYSLENLSYANLMLYNFIATFLFSEKNIQLQKDEVSKSMVTKSILFMREQLHEMLTIEKIARHVNLSTSHFSFLFRKSTGMSPIDYFIQLKLQNACQQLDLTDKRIKEVAECVGYGDAHYFSRIFKKHIGQSPEQYRMAKKG
jgi:transcriptional regulator GlxA family with amidase domain